jgi:50S ribosomal protein L16 3-hydroxylase
VFQSRVPPRGRRAVRLAPGSRMLYDAHHVFINGESFRAAGADATLLRRLADRQVLEPGECGKLSAQARALLAEWVRCGWLVAAPLRGAENGDS